MSKVLLLGSGGREHAISWKLAQSSQLDELFIAPGNAGTAELGTNIDLDILNFEAVHSFCVEQQIDILFPGSEAPLVHGIVDYFQERQSATAVIGPNRIAAQLEGSKKFAKEFMSRHQIPTAAYREFSKHSMENGLRYIGQKNPPIVLKADGLAAGKGVIICQDIDQAQSEFRDMLSGKFGEASATVVIEDFLSGREFSAFICTDGESYSLLPTAKDYKRIGEGDCGLNTGGMGSVSPVSFISTDLWQKVVTRIINPTITGIQKERLVYKGFIFFGLIEVNGDPYVIEYNCRLGDPETQSILPRIASDFLQLLIDCSNNEIGRHPIEISDHTSSTVVLASGGYPQTYEKGKPINIHSKLSDCNLFHAGINAVEGQLLTNGGRVMGVNALANTLHESLDKVYQQIELIEFDKKYFRRDIGYDLQ